MPYRAAKISFDGSHYIAIPKENFPQEHKRRRAARPLSVEEIEKKEQFEAAYKESQKLPRKERKTYMRKAMEEAIPDKEQLKEYVERNNERKTTNKIRRKVRLARKAYLQEWSFFCTFTYSDKLHTEESFRKSLRNTFKHLVARKGWKHIGVWERGGDTNRLHFHGIFYIPPGGMVGELTETRDYSTKDHRMQTAHQNTYFLKIAERMLYFHRRAERLKIVAPVSFEVHREVGRTLDLRRKVADLLRFRRHGRGHSLSLRDRRQESCSGG